MDARPPRSLACSSARAPPCMRSYPASLGKGAPPSTTAGRAARDRCSGRRRTSASRSCSKRTLPSNMAGCARQLRWSCKLLAVQLLRERERLVCVSRETVRRALHRLGFRWRRPRPVPPEKDSEEQREQKRARLEDVLQMVEGAGSFFQDETRLETNPKVGFCWMRKGKRKPLPAPGTNRQAWISGALNFHTGRLHWVVGKRKDGGLFIDLLDDELRRT